MSVMPNRRAPNSERGEFRSGGVRTHAPGMNDTDQSTTDQLTADQLTADDDALHPRPIDVRRAVLGMLMRADEGLSLGEMRAALLSRDGIEVDGKRLADLVRWQMRRGRVRRVGRGRYAFVVGSMSRSSAWRCLHWKLVARRRWERDQRGLGTVERR